LLSAFLSAGRSILQYTHNYALQEKKTSEYEALVDNDILRYFKNERDFIIHRAPVQPFKQFHESVNITFSVVVDANPTQIRYHEDGT
jgi:hypothetical protein